MKRMSKYAGMLAMAVILAFVAGCTDDEEDVKYELCGRQWVGDIGMNDDFGNALYSKFYFAPDGFGDEYQYYMNGEFFTSYRFRWFWEHTNNNNLVLDYGAHGISYMDDVQIGYNTMTGIFYLTEWAPGIPFTFEMW